MNKRGSGILLHITSLPSSYGVGDLGPGAYRFADFLTGAKQTTWQVLPLNPTYPIYGNSPYSSISAFAGNTLLISPDLLIEEGLLSREDLEPVPPFPEWERTGVL
jgi:4-alpha-glucanotransferase